MIIAQLPGIDLALGIPGAIVTILRTLPLTGSIATGQLLETGAALLRVVPTSQFMSQGETDEPDKGISADSQEPLRPYTGMDGIYVWPGSSWLQSPH